MFRKLKERIERCEMRLDECNRSMTDYMVSQGDTNIKMFRALDRTQRNVDVQAYKPNADILLDCVMECKDRTRLFVNGVETIYEVDHDTPIEALYRRIYKAVGFRKVTIYSYEIKDGVVNFTVETRGDTVD